MNSKDISNLIELSKEVKDVLDKSAVKLGLSARAYHRVIKLARTIADLEKKINIELKEKIVLRNIRHRSII